MSNGDNEWNDMGRGPWGRLLLARGAQSQCRCCRARQVPAQNAVGSMGQAFARHGRARTSFFSSSTSSFASIFWCPVASNGRFINPMVCHGNSQSLATMHHAPCPCNQHATRAPLERKPAIPADACGSDAQELVRTLSSSFWNSASFFSAFSCAPEQQGRSSVGQPRSSGGEPECVGATIPSLFCRLQCRA